MPKIIVIFLYKRSKDCFQYCNTKIIVTVTGQCSSQKLKKPRTATEYIQPIIRPDQSPNKTESSFGRNFQFKDSFAYGRDCCIQKQNRKYIANSRKLQKKWQIQLNLLKCKLLCISNKTSPPVKKYSFCGLELE